MERVEVIFDVEMVTERFDSINHVIRVALYLFKPVDSRSFNRLEINSTDDVGK